MKIAVSIPYPVFAAAEKLAKSRKISRSRLYAEALESYVGERAAASVTERLDAVYAAEPTKLDPLLAIAQRRSIDDEAW